MSGAVGRRRSPVAPRPGEATERLARLRRILMREREQGAQDRLVIGGLTTLVARWADELRSLVPAAAQAPLQHLITLSAGYRDLAPDARVRRLTALDEALDRLGDALRAPSPVDIAAVATRLNSQPAPATASAQTAPAARPRPSRPQSPVGPDEPLSALTGIGTARARLFARLHITTVESLLYHVPSRYEDYTATPPVVGLIYGQRQTVVGRFTQVDTSPTRRGSVRVVARLEDHTGAIRCTWFWPAHMARSRPLPLNELVVVSGRVGQFNGSLAFEQPDYELADRDLLSVGRLVPVYPATEGLYQKQIRAAIRAALDAAARSLPDPLPTRVREEMGLLPLAEALERIHFPASEADIRAARLRLAVDELLLIQLTVQRRRSDWQSGHAPVLPLSGEATRPVTAFLEGLPFALTAAQRHALDEILADLATPRPMSRLLQGDVGSGKTVVAATAMLAATARGYQAAIMAPTEILAEQHARNLDRLYSHLPESDRPRVELVKGGMTRKQKQAAAGRIASGAVNVIVGTHALIQESIAFHNLALVVVDEQHRFGVAQRAVLREKGLNPHLLVMTATPIPRSLALTIHGDLDLTIIDQLPPGRQTIETRFAGAEARARAYDFIRKEITAGRQAFIICPLVEESEAIEARAATAEYERLQREIFPDLRLALLHGRMRPAEKEAVMRRFRDAEADILISTAVVEVGIDVPNATVMLIEGADRFGLAQLHQFRGRVGRGAHRSYCLLLADDASERSAERLRLLASTADGFALAEHDLRLRGPGEFFGTRQSGLPALRVANLGDAHAIDIAQRLAGRLLAADPGLSHPDHATLAIRLASFAAQGAGDIS